MPAIRMLIYIYNMQQQWQGSAAVVGLFVFVDWVERERERDGVALSKQV